MSLVEITLRDSYIPLKNHEQCPSTCPKHSQVGAPGHCGPSFRGTSSGWGRPLGAPRGEMPGLEWEHVLNPFAPPWFHTKPNLRQDSSICLKAFEKMEEYGRVKRFEELLQPLFLSTRSQF